MPQAEQQAKGRRVQAAKRHTDETRVEAGQGTAGQGAAVEMAARAAPAADGAGGSGSKSASDKKED